jgi:hypothetical protein
MVRKPFIGLLGEHPVDRMEEVGIGPLAGSAHPAPQLVELAQSQPIGAVHHQRVDRGHVDPRLDDGGAHQHVVAPLPEVEHDLLERALVHLAVGHGHPRLGGHGVDALGHRVDVLDPVVHVEDLALPQQLAPDGLHAAASSNSPTWVRIGRRAAGGVLIIDRSRMPVRAISRVRGWGWPSG